MNKWQFFAYLYQHFDVQFMAAVQAMIGAAVQAVRPPLIAGVTVYLAATTADDLMRPGGDPFHPFIRRAIRVIVVLLAVTAANYTQWFANELLQDIPNGVSQALAGATGGQQVTANAFDQLWNAAWASGEEVYKNIPSWSFKGMGMMLLVGLYWVAAAVAVGVAFLIYIASHIMLGLLVSVGPFFVALFMWDWSRKFFEGWIATCLAVVVTQIFVVGLLALLIGVENEIVREIAGNGGPLGVNANDEMSQIQFLVEALVCYAMMAFLAKQLPAFAARIMNGVAPDIAGISSMAHGALFAPVRAGGRAAAPHVARGARLGVAAGARAARAVGRAI